MYLCVWQPQIVCFEVMPFWTLLEYFSRAVLNLWTQCIIFALEWNRFTTRTCQVMVSVLYIFTDVLSVNQFASASNKMMTCECSWCFRCQQRQENYSLCCDGYYSYYVITICIREVLLLCSAVGIICILEYLALVVEQLATEELERVWQEAVLAWSKYSLVFYFRDRGK